jgi:hypothetical protein
LQNRRASLLARSATTARGSEGRAETRCNHALRQLRRQTLDGERLPRLLAQVPPQLEREGRVNSGLTLYGMRHSVAVILCECGFDERTIADALGQKTIEMARHCARGADLSRKWKG